MELQSIMNGSDAGCSREIIKLNKEKKLKSLKHIMLIFVQVYEYWKMIIKKKRVQ